MCIFQEYWYHPWSLHSISSRIWARSKTLHQKRLRTDRSYGIVVNERAFKLTLKSLHSLHTVLYRMFLTVSQNLFSQHSKIWSSQWKETFFFLGTNRIKHRLIMHDKPQLYRFCWILGNDQLDTHLLYFIVRVQYVYYNPLHVSSIVTSSSGGWIVLIQHLVSSISESDRPVHRPHSGLWPDDEKVRTQILPSFVYVGSQKWHVWEVRLSVLWFARQRKKPFFLSFTSCFSDDAASCTLVKINFKISWE
jgi:hypothetical protein